MVAEPVVLLHGQPGGSADWEHVVAALGDEVRVLAPDRPGWDRSSPPSGVAGNGRALIELLDRERVARATVVGHSFGGAIASWVAAHAPERVRALVLAAPAANLASLYALDRWLATPLLGSVAAATLLGGAGLVLSTRRARQGVAWRLRVPEGYLEQAGRSLRSPRAWHAFAVEQQALLRELPELELSLPRITAPTTIVIGESDRVVPPRSAGQLQRQMPEAEVEIVPGAGHLLPLFQAERLAAVILRAAGAA